MAQYTAAYSNFVARLEEVRTLRRFAAVKEKSDPIACAEEIGALCRGAIVLLSAHLEAYIRDVGALALDSLYAKNIDRTAIVPQFYYHLSKDLLTYIQDSSEPDKIAESVFSFIERDGGQWSKTGPFPDALSTERFSKGFANPKYKKIRAYFGRFGYSTYDGNLAAELRALYQPTVNLVDHLVDTRNAIAHGDPAATKTPSEVSQMKSTVQLFCRKTDQVFAAWWRRQFCAIR